jgi:CheY-like chemotaxis protein
MSNYFSTAKILLLGSLVSCGTLAAQDIEDTPDPLVVQLEERAARGNDFLAESIAAFARIGEWELVEKWLTRVAPINDDAVLADMAGRIGPAILLRIARREELSDQARATIVKLGKAARKIAESKQDLAAVISQLGGSVDQQLGAMRKLLVGGDAAVAALVEAAVKVPPPAPQDTILRTMLSLGSGGEQALAQLALYGQPQIRPRALQALLRINVRANAPALLTARYAADATEAEIKLATANLPRVFGAVPTNQEAIALLFTDLRRKRAVANEIANDAQSATLWSINNSRDGVEYQSTRSILAAYRDAADASARLRRVGQLPSDVQDAALAADLSYRVMIDPDWGDQAQVDQIRTTYGSAASGFSLSNSIANSLEINDYPAVIGLLRLIGENPTVVELNILLSGNSPAMTPLVQATLNSNPRVRYEAAAAIARLKPQAPYAGRSHVRRCFSEMFSLGNREIAVLVETRPEVVLQQEQILTELGYEVRVVGTVAAVERILARGGELSLIVSKTQLADLPPIELIDRVRRDPRGRFVPIVFYGETAVGVETERWDAMTRYVERPKLPAAFRDVIFDMQRIPRTFASENAVEPIALLVETRPDVIDLQEAVIANFGYEVRVLRTVQQLDEIGASGDDIGLIAAPLQTGVLPPLEFVNRVRNFPEGKLIPIVLYRDDTAGLDTENSDPFSGPAPRPVTAAAYSSIIVAIEQTRRLPPLTDLDRRLYRGIAAQSLGKNPTGD